MGTVVAGEVSQGLDVSQFIQGNQLKCRSILTFEIRTQNAAANAAQAIYGNTIAQSIPSTASMM
jgi:sulfate adenylyltransferase subunit 1 (EFTu-like GTPase family)